MSLNERDIFEEVEAILVEKLLNPDMAPHYFPEVFSGLSGKFRPLYIPITKKYAKFRFELDNEEPVSLNFSYIVFAGSYKKNSPSRLLNEHAECTQSSGTNYLFQNANKGVRGSRYSLNIHTEAEQSPWWEASFPAECFVNQIFFYNRMDEFGHRANKLKVYATTSFGEEDLIYDAQSRANKSAFTSEIITYFCEGLKGLYRNADKPSKEAIENWLDHIIHYFREATNKKVGYFRRHKDKQNNRKKQLEALNNQYLDILHSFTDIKPDFGGKRPSGRFVEIKDKPVRYVRLEVYGKLATKIGGIEVEHSDGDNKQTFWLYDEKLKNFKPSYENSEHYRFGLTTPWHGITIDLEDVVSVKKILIWNSDKSHSGSTVFHKIMISKDGETWQTALDSGQDYLNIMKALSFIELSNGINWIPKSIRIMGKMLSLYRQVAPIRQIVVSIRKTPELTEAFEAGTLEAIPLVQHAKPLRLTKHGLQIPLKYQNTDKIIEHMQSLIDVFKAKNLEPFLMYGTLLGAIREKDFIAHDDDVDMAVITNADDMDQLKEKTQSILEQLKEAGVKCSLAGTIAPLIHCRIKNITFDLFILGNINNEIVWPTTYMKMDKAPADIFLPLSELSFKGHVFAAPKDPEAVLVARYGETWRTPIAAFEM
jgi:hypothetical protein